MHAGTHYPELVFLHLAGSVGHIVHSVASGAQNINAPFSCSGGTKLDSTKSALEHVTPNLCFLHPVGFAGYVVHSDVSGA
jgi:hypothetical protein